MVIDKNKTTLVTIYQVDLGLGVDFNKQYVAELKAYVNDELLDIEELKTQYEATVKDNNEAIDNFKEKNKMLQAEMEHNNSEIKF